MSTIENLNMDRVQSDEIARIMMSIGRAARAATAELANASTQTKNHALKAMAGEIRTHKQDILAANQQDVKEAKQGNISSAFLDRLILTEDRVADMATSLEAIADLADPVGQVMAEWTRPNGLHISRVRVPLGVIGIIYESRPNVTADAGALCLKAGNAVILRSGSESFHSSQAIHTCLTAGLSKAGLPIAAIQLVPTTDRAAVGILLKDMVDYIDVIIPRGGKSLVERVQREARVPVLAHLEGLCHIYVDKAAQIEKAIAITLNAKMRRTGICGAAETLLIDRAVLDTHLKPIIGALVDAGCQVRGDGMARAIDDRIEPATEQDWTTEYLDAIISVKVVDDVDGAIEHIRHYGSHHTDSIITEDQHTADRFLKEVDSAIVMHNTSTQFADGGEFGMGAEIGISTSRLHSPGPVGAEQLTTFKYVVRGTGQTRP